MQMNCMVVFFFFSQIYWKERHWSRTLSSCKFQKTSTCSSRPKADGLAENLRDNKRTEVRPCVQKYCENQPNKVSWQQAGSIRSSWLTDVGKKKPGILSSETFFNILGCASNLYKRWGWSISASNDCDVWGQHVCSLQQATWLLLFFSQWCNTSATIIIPCS